MPNRHGEGTQWVGEPTSPNCFCDCSSSLCFLVLEQMFASHSQSANVLDLRDLVEGSLNTQNSSDFDIPSNPLSTQSSSIASSHEVFSPSPPQREQKFSQPFRQDLTMPTSFRFPTRQVTLAKKKLTQVNTAPNQSTEELSATIRKIEGILHKCKTQVDEFESSAVMHQRQHEDTPSPRKKKRETIEPKKPQGPERKRKRPEPTPAAQFDLSDGEENDSEELEARGHRYKRKKQTYSPPSKAPETPDQQQNKQLEQIVKDITQIKDQLGQLSNFCHHTILFELTEIRKALGRQSEVPRYVVPWEYMAPMGYQSQFHSQRRIGSVGTVNEVFQSGDDLLFEED